MPRALLLFCVVFVLAACDQKKPYKAPTPNVEPSSSTRLFSSERQALDRAKGVEATVRQNADRQRQTVDDASK